MCKVFVFGATGFIGNALAKRFQINGYEVTGLTRNEEKAKELRKLEINAIVGAAKDPSTWLAAATNSDIIIEAMSDYADHNSAVELAKTLSQIAQKDKSKIIIYTSGVWVYGNTTSPVDDNSPFNPAPLVSGRPTLQKVYTDMGAIVLLPGVVYGGQGSLTAHWFKSLGEGKATFPGRANDEPFFAMVHVDDLSDLYLKVAQNGNNLRSQCIIGVGQCERVRDCLQSAAKVIGYQGEIKFTAPADPFSECLSLNQSQIHSLKGKTQLGWTPKQRTFVAGAQKYFNTWKALTSK